MERIKTVRGATAGAHLLAGCAMSNVTDDMTTVLTKSLRHVPQVQRSSHSLYSGAIAVPSAVRSSCRAAPAPGARSLAFAWQSLTGMNVSRAQ